jgi:hypothetical protein
MTDSPKPSQLPTEKAIEKLFPKEVVAEIRKLAHPPQNPDKTNGK